MCYGIISHVAHSSRPAKDVTLFGVETGGSNPLWAIDLVSCGCFSALTRSVSPLTKALGDGYNRAELGSAAPTRFLVEKPNQS